MQAVDGGAWRLRGVFLLLPRHNRNHGKNTVHLESRRAVCFSGVLCKKPLCTPIRVQYVRAVRVL